MNATRILANLFAFAKRSGQLLECQHEVRTSVDEYGVPQYAAPVPFHAMWLPERERVRTLEGEDVMANGRLVVPAGTAIDRGDRITLPDGTPVSILTLSSVGDRTAFPYLEVTY